MHELELVVSLRFEVRVRRGNQVVVATRGVQSEGESRDWERESERERERRER